MHTLTLCGDQAAVTISPHIYGHFAEHLGRCVYEGLWVGEDSPIPNTRGFRNDVVQALRALNIPNLRWPGGCFADTYHWMDGIGPRSERPSIVNIHWGGTTENNHCGTHEFLDLCGQLGCEPYICGNVGSGTVREMAEWLEYLTMAGESPMANLRRANGRQEPWDVTYWAVGNENWGCGGNMRPQFYADLFRQYATYCRNFKPGGKLYKVACGFGNEWNEVLLREAARFMDGLSIHYYTIPGLWSAKGSATNFAVEDWQVTLQKAWHVDTFLAQTSAIMDRYDPEKRIGMILDEWGTWYDVEPGTNPGFLYQQNSMRDALVAALSFNIFHQHAERLHMANIAQTVNVLQAMVLTDGARMLLTPTYHVFEMYKVHHGAKQIPVKTESSAYIPARGKSTVSGTSQEYEMTALPQISASASRNAEGKVHLSICNLHHAENANISCRLQGLEAKAVSARILAAPEMHTHNTFDEPTRLQPVRYEGCKLDGNGISMDLPARSVVVVEIL